MFRWFHGLLFKFSIYELFMTASQLILLLTDQLKAALFYKEWVYGLLLLLTSPPLCCHHQIPWKDGRKPQWPHILLDAFPFNKTSFLFYLIKIWFLKKYLESSLIFVLFFLREKSNKKENSKCDSWKKKNESVKN